MRGDRVAGAGRLRPWALAVVAHRSYPRLAAEVELITAHRPPIVITALGSPRDVVETVHAYGGTVLADVATTSHARKAAAAGVDGLLLVCAGAGGHTGQYSPVRVPRGGAPLLARADRARGRRRQRPGRGRGPRPRRRLVSVGTRFIATQESLVSDAYRDMVVRAELGDLVVSDALTGAPAAWLRPSLEAAGAAAPAATGGLRGPQ